jgi:NAD(P)-dependent dehydrogenase (short-subunit alcohol dehydrogenase family)
MASDSILKDFSLEGQGAMVVGAENPAGRACAIALAEAGARVLLASQDPGQDAPLKEIAKAVAGTPGALAEVRSQNAAIRADLSATADLAVKKFGRLDILVNALDGAWYGPADTADDTAFEHVFENNFKTVWMSCQEGARVMLPKGGGTIVNVTSVLAQRGVPNASLYCAAKAAVLNLTRALALEWGRKGIRVNAIEAGWLDEPASPTRADEEFKKNLIKYLPYNRLLKPEELGGALVYLVSPSAGFVTGESIVVDGGLMCRV